MFTRLSKYQGIALVATLAAIGVSVLPRRPRIPTNTSDLVREIQQTREELERLERTLGFNFSDALVVTGGGNMWTKEIVTTMDGSHHNLAFIRFRVHPQTNESGKPISTNGVLQILDASGQIRSATSADFYPRTLIRLIMNGHETRSFFLAALDSAAKRAVSEEDLAQLIRGIKISQLTKQEKMAASVGVWAASKNRQTPVVFSNVDDFYVVEADPTTT